MSALSVVVCTYRRAHLVAGVLERLLAQTVAPTEVLLVDNEGSAEVAQTVSTLAKRADFSLRYVHEPSLGLSHARNRGVAESTSPLVAFLDDDAFAARGWVEHLVRGAAEHPAAGVFAGAVEPITDGPLPPHFLEDIGPYATWLGALELGPGDLPLINQGSVYAGPVGANMMFTRAALDRVGRFDPSLGRVGTRLVSGEEVVLVNAARAAGFEAWYLGQARVQHLVHRDRLSHAWFLERAYFEGVSIAVALRAQGELESRARLLEQQCVQLCAVLERVRGSLSTLPLKTRIEVMKIAGRIIESAAETAVAQQAAPALDRLRTHHELQASLPNEAASFFAR